MADKYNKNNPSVKRIMQEVREMRKQQSSQFHAAPLEDDLFEWHFTIRGPRETPFAGGIYHGRILLPAEYPFKPPNIILLTPNGRFEVGQKICLSISAHHPEYWQPSWSIRTVLVALIGFMPTKGGGAIAALDYPPKERIDLANKSKSWTCERCGAKAETILPEEDPEEDLGHESLPAELKVSPSSETSPSSQTTNSNNAPETSLPPPSQTTTPSNNVPEIPPPSQTTAPSNNASENPTPVPQATNVTNVQNNTAPSQDPGKTLDFLIFAVLFALVALLLRKFITNGQNEL